MKWDLPTAWPRETSPGWWGPERSGLNPPCHSESNKGQQARAQERVTVRRIPSSLEGGLRGSFLTPALREKRVKGWSHPRPTWVITRLNCRYPIYMTEKAMAPHSSTLAWKILWTEEPGRLQSMESLRVGNDWATSLSLFTFLHWRRKWQPTPVFLPGESQGRGSLVGCHLWGRTESDTTEAT